MADDLVAQVAADLDRTDLDPVVIDRVRDVNPERRQAHRFKASPAVMRHASRRLSKKRTC